MLLTGIYNHYELRTNLDIEQWPVKLYSIMYMLTHTTIHLHTLYHYAVLLCTII